MNLVLFCLMDFLAVDFLSRMERQGIGEYGFFFFLPTLGLRFESFNSGSGTR